MGKMGNKNVVANNRQIVEGIKRGVIDAMTTVLGSLNNLGARLDLSKESMNKFVDLNNTMTRLSQYTAPLVTQGRLLPATATLTSNMSNDLSNILDELHYQSNDSISISDLRSLLIDVARNYISYDFYMGDEQVARSANRGNLSLGRRAGRI